MRTRLKAALSKGDTAACRREGDNLARYQRAKEGEALIEADLRAVEKRLIEIRTVYDQLRQVRDLKLQGAVEQAYGLIRGIAAKMAEDVVTEVTVTLVTAPVPGAGKIVTEMGKQAADFLGNFNDAGKVVNRAKAMKSLDAMARYADEQMKTLIPAIQEARWTRGMLNECRQQYLAGAAGKMPAMKTEVKAPQPAIAKGGGLWVLYDISRGNENKGGDYATVQFGDDGLAGTFKLNPTDGRNIPVEIKWSLPPAKLVAGSSITLTAKVTHGSLQWPGKPLEKTANTSWSYGKLVWDGKIQTTEGTATLIVPELNARGTLGNLYGISYNASGQAGPGRKAWNGVTFKYKYINPGDAMPASPSYQYMKDKK
ncbi:MAG: hypothetical protein HPY65_13160 [Syntrophaceae bacterium]|nr:hypothetical protein [Syntrophaceae bacterium]